VARPPQLYSLCFGFLPHQTPQYVCIPLLPIKFRLNYFQASCLSKTSHCSPVQKNNFDCNQDFVPPCDSFFPPQPKHLESSSLGWANSGTSFRVYILPISLRILDLLSRLLRLKMPLLADGRRSPDTYVPDLEPPQSQQTVASFI
jgi:hypothetical protein